mgnify:FL=1|jgi:hypothetical protein
MKGLRPRGGVAYRPKDTPPNRVPFFPGRGHRLCAPPVRVFYSSKVRAAAGFWSHMGAGRQVMQWIRHGVKLEFHSGPPAPYARPPRLVEPQDIDFTLEKIEEGYQTGAHGLIPLDSSGHSQARWLAAAHVVTSAAKQRLVVDYSTLNDACTAATCKYESMADLMQVLTPTSWLLSCDISAAYHHCRMAPAHRKYTGFHLALPVFHKGRALPLQPGGYFVYAHDLSTQQLQRFTQQQKQRGQVFSRAEFETGSQLPTGSQSSSSAPLYQVVELCAYALNFGARASPLVFTKHMRALVKYLRAHAIGVVIYIDDLAFCVEGSRQAALRARDFIEKTLTSAGLTRHPTKGQFLEPSQVLVDHLGFELNIPLNLLRVPERRCVKIRRLATALLCESARNRRLVDSSLLRQFAGVACSTQQAVRSARFHLRAIYDCLAFNRPLSRLDRAALHDLRFWSSFELTSEANGIPIFRSPSSRALYTDASGGIGWGGVMPSDTVQQRLCRARARFPAALAQDLHAAAGIPCPQHLHLQSSLCADFWSAELLPLHINFKELRAVHRALLVWGKQLAGHRVLLFVDNTCVVQLLKHGTSRSPLLMAELRVVWQLLLDLRITLDPIYVASSDNPADHPSRQLPTDAWTFRRPWRDKLQSLTPRPFSLDPFATAATAMAPAWCGLLDEEHSTAVDGFSVSWTGHNLFLNPPWREMGRVIHKICEDRASGVLILPRWPSQPWWPLALRLRARWLTLPRPKFCVLPLHNGRVDPFANHATRLMALVFDGKRGLKRGSQIFPRQ